MDDGVRVVLAVEATRIAEEVLHHLDRSGLAFVIGTASDDRQLVEATRQLDPDVVIASPGLAGVVRDVPVLALDPRETVAGLRMSLQAGARGFFVWPDERERLLGAVVRSRVGAAAGTQGVVVAVRGARGGAGATFVCAHLAAALARAGRACLLVDGDPLQGDLASVLGVPDDPDGGVEPTSGATADPTEASDARAAVDADTPWTHDAGFRVVFARSPLARPASLGSVVASASRVSDVVLAHLPRALDEAAMGALANADVLLHVLTLDAVSFRAAHRAQEALTPRRLSARSLFLVNRAARSEIAPGDVRRVFGEDPIAVIPWDRGVERAMSLGRLLPPRHRISRRFDRAAGRLAATDAEVAA